MPQPEAGEDGVIYRSMRELAIDERPRERLLHYGAEVLGDAELVAILLGSGLRGENATDVGRRLLESVGGLSGLARARPSALQRVKGLGPARAAQLTAAIELGRRVQRTDPEDRPLLATPEAVHAFLGPRLLGQPREMLFVLALDSRSRLIGSPAHVPGNANSVPIRTGDVFREAIVGDAVQVILVHNHPSGHAMPSPQDVIITQGIIAAGELLGIEVVDHVIIGHNGFISMRQSGYGFTPEVRAARRAAR